MDLLYNLFHYANDLIVLALTAAGAVLMALRGVMGRVLFGLLAGLGRGAGAGIGSKLTSRGSSATAASGAGKTRSPLGRSHKKAREALLEAAARQQRMRTYIQAWFDLLSYRGGPHAVSIHLASLLVPGFHEKVNRLRRRCREFDRLEARAQQSLRRYEREYARRCEPLRDEIILLEHKQLIARNHRRRFFWRPFHRRRHHYSRQIRAMRKRLVPLRRRHFFTEWRLNRKYRPIVEPAFRALSLYERMYLYPWVHSFEADLESLRLTVVSGRFMDMLIQPQHADLRARCELHELPDNAGEMVWFLKQRLTEWGVGFGPRASVETLLETYLRGHFIQNETAREAMGFNLVWLETHLPLPGTLGITQQRYNHLAGQ